MSEATQDWALPERSRPPLIGELVERIEEALATARASEAAVMTVGAAALDAAEQARRAAELAERASVAIGAMPAATPAPAPPPGGSLAAAGRGPADSAMGEFTARADRVAERLRRLEDLRLPVSA